jgi:hypothetical protein
MVIAMQRLGKYVLAATDTGGTIDELLETVFFVVRAAVIYTAFTRRSRYQATTSKDTAGWKDSDCAFSYLYSA